VPLPARRQNGFSLAELVVALLVAVILVAVSLPLFLRAYRSYQLSNAARQVADILRLSRYQAIRLNKPVICVFGPFSGDATMTSASMTDASGTPLTGLAAATIVLGSTGNLVASSAVPGNGTFPTQANLGSMVPTSFSPAGGSVKFDARGAVMFPPNVNAYAFYLASAAAPDAGYRAVLLLSAGSMQIWVIDASGNWEEQR
jgi:prepilin-type N-terminal cleavage/methylation domain-containing protein